jgi:hypothetical protein
MLGLWPYCHEEERSYPGRGLVVAFVILVTKE